MRELAILTSSGSEFHSSGAQKQKALSLVCLKEKQWRTDWNIKWKKKFECREEQGLDATVKQGRPLNDLSSRKVEKVEWISSTHKQQHAAHSYSERKRLFSCRYFTDDSIVFTLNRRYNLWIRIICTSHLTGLRLPLTNTHATEGLPAFLFTISLLRNCTIVLNGVKEAQRALQMAIKIWLMIDLSVWSIISLELTS